MTDPLQDIRHYSPTMTISQVLKFCEKKSLSITRPMIQNYIRDGLLPSPIKKRFYTHKHLAALVMIDRLKTVFDIPTIQKTLVPHMDEEGLPLDIYNYLIEKTAHLVQLWKKAQENAAFHDISESGTLLAMTCAAELKVVATC